MSIRDEILHALRVLLDPGAVTELRVLDGVAKGERSAREYSGYFDDHESLAGAVGSLVTYSGAYVIPNPVRPDLLARAANRIRPAKKGMATGDQHVLRRTRLLIDVDPVRPAGISSTDPEHDEALARAKSILDFLGLRGWPDPAEGDSGNGAHLVYAVDLPTDDGGVCQRCLKALAARFGDDTVTVDTSTFNPSRIWKLYGTMARKGDSTPERPHRVARLLRVPEPLAVVPRGLLESLADEAPKPKPTAPPARPPAAADVNAGRRLDPAERCKRYIDKLPDAISGRKGHDRTFNWACVCYRFGLDDGSARRVLEWANANKTGGEQWNDAELAHKLKDARAEVETAGEFGVLLGGAAAAAAVPAPGNHRPATAAPPRPPAVTAKPARVPPPVYVPFPIETLPRALAQFVSQASASLGCDHAYVALPLLASLGAAIGNSRRIRLKRRWAEPPILWTCVVADSGTLKSPAHEIALSPIHRRQAQAHRSHQAGLNEYDAAVESYDAQLKEWKGMDPAARGERPSPPGRPVCERILCQDVTVEALADRLMKAPRGLLVERDELSGLIGGFNQYKAGGKGSDASHWLSMHRGGALWMDRKTGEATTTYVPRAAVSVAGGIQPKILREVLGREFFDNGFAARLLLAMPPHREKRWTDQDLDDHVLQRMDEIVAALFALQPSETPDGPAPKDVALSGPALRTFKAFFDEHARETADLGDDLAAAWSKLEGYAPRLALILHLVRTACGEVLDADTVDRESMAPAIELVRWFGREAKRVYASLAERDSDRRRRRLAETVQVKGGHLTAVELTRLSRRYRPTEAAQAALDELVSYGYGRWEGESFILRPADDPEDPSEHDGENPRQRANSANAPTGSDESGDSSLKTQFFGGGENKFVGADMSSNLLGISPSPLAPVGAARQRVDGSKNGDSGPKTRFSEGGNGAVGALARPEGEGEEDEYERLEREAIRNEASLSAPTDLSGREGDGGS